MPDEKKDRAPASRQLPKRKVVWDAESEDQIDAVKDSMADRERDLEWILSTARGRRWLYDLIHGYRCHVRQASLVPGDLSSTGLNEGARMVGENIMEEIRGKHFERWLQMMEENHGD